jgi:hypothetical protein
MRFPCRPARRGPRCAATGATRAPARYAGAIARASGRGRSDRQGDLLDAGDGSVYFGSADTWFYAVGPRAKLRWRFKTGEIIDSATIGRYDPRLRTSPITVGSGDESLYRLRSDRDALSRARRVIWTYRSPSRIATCPSTATRWGSPACATDGTLITTGNYLTRAYDRRGAANRRPTGLRVTSVELRPTASSDGLARARFELFGGRAFPAKRHLTTVLLTDARTGTPVSVDYRKESNSIAGPGGDLAETRVRIPAGTRVPARIRAYVIADAFPLASRGLR